MIASTLLSVVLSLAPAHANDAPDILEPLRTGERTPADAAVVIGIENYPFVSDVPHAQRDAQAMYNLLVFTRGVPADRVTLLDRGASREQILSAVERAGGQVGRDGTVWVYFAGHGAADTATGDRLLLGDDVRQDSSAFSARGVSVKELKELAGKGGGSVYMMVDACYAGVGRDGEELLAGKRFLVPAYTNQANARLLEWNAAGANQLSGPIDAVRHGAFTYFAVGALRGWADGHLDGKPDGKVTAEEAKVYVNSALRTLQNHDQQSVLTATDPSRVVLSSSDRLESGPDVRLISSLREAPPASEPSTSQPSAPAASGPQPPADSSNRNAVQAWVNHVVNECYHQHGQEDASLRQWYVRFRVHPRRGLGGMIISAPEASMSHSMSAVHTCIRGEIRGHSFDLPRSAVTYQNYHTAEAAPSPPPPPVAQRTERERTPRQDRPRGGPGIEIDTPDGRFSMTIPGATTGPERDTRRRSSPAPAEPQLPNEVEIVLRNPDNDWTDVRINGEVVAEFRNQREMTVTVRPGTHFIEFVPFMKDTPFASGRLETGTADNIIFGLSHSNGVTCFNHDGWQPR